MIDPEIRYVSWKDNEVVYPDITGNNIYEWQGYFCIDTFCEGEQMRYGTYRKQGGWQHIPLKDFPTDFQMALILLGIT